MSRLIAHNENFRVVTEGSLAKFQVKGNANELGDPWVTRLVADLSELASAWEEYQEWLEEGEVEHDEGVPVAALLSDRGNPIRIPPPDVPNPAPDPSMRRSRVDDVPRCPHCGRMWCEGH